MELYGTLFHFWLLSLNMMFAGFIPFFFFFNVLLKAKFPRRSFVSTIKVLKAQIHESHW